MELEENTIYNKPLLTIKETSILFNIGKNKLYEITDSQDCNFVLFIGNKRLIKKEEFMKYIKSQYSI